MIDEIQIRGGSFAEGLQNGHRLLHGHPGAALTQAQTLLKLGPDPRALRLAAAAHRKLGEAAAAEAAELAAIQQSLALRELEAAARAEHEGRSAEASALAADQLRSEPDDLLAATISAEAAISLRRLAEGEQLLRRVLGRAPSFLRASMFLARNLMLQSRIGEAVMTMQEGANRVPNNLPANKFLAQLQAEARDYEAAAATYERLLGPNDKDAELWVSYGDMLRFLGRRTDSELAYRRAVFTDAAGGAAWWALANLDPASLTDVDLGRMEAALVKRGDRPEDAGALHFALGEALENRGNYAGAFEHFAHGNCLRENAQPYDPSILTQEVDQSIALFTPDFFRAHSSEAAQDASPIFILGMPRSGSTLVERILGGHTQIEAAGELPIIPRQVEVMSVQGGGVGHYRNIVEGLREKEIGELGKTYVERAREFRKSDKPYFTDKLHMNWRHIGLIKLILPNARIVDVRRGALECCWSNFKLLFTRGHPAASNLAHIGHFYADYVRMMDHMDTVAAGSVLRVRYEDLVDDVERETRRMLTFLGVPFEAGCLNFHQSSDPVATASSEQVRRPLNRDGIGTWKPYAQWLGPLREALGSLADDSHPAT